MSYGIKKTDWFLDEDHSRPFIQHALDLGINFFDTANMYGEGASEEVLGRALRDYAKRDEIVVATKVYFPMRPDANGRGLSRKAIMTEVERSLRRLGTDYVDLYQIHRWDYETPIEETLEALHDVVKSGKARYIGASSMFAWQFCKALYLADLHRWTRFISMQPHYNLLNREEEREMLGLCSAEGVGVLPWSPLARGRLTRAWESLQDTKRGQSDQYGRLIYLGTEEADKRVADSVGKVSTARGITRAQTALAWLFSKRVVTAPIIGATRTHHLEEAVAALEIKLSDAEIRELEAPYVPHPLVGFE
jgi:aryl-alcohol dehydrogenase-like predicted oxidoreductase